MARPAQLAQQERICDLLMEFEFGGRKVSEGKRHMLSRREGPDTVENREERLYGKDHIELRRGSWFASVGFVKVKLRRWERGPGTLEHHTFKISEPQAIEQFCQERFRRPGRPVPPD